MWRLLGTGGHMGVVPGPCPRPLPGPAAAVAAVASGGGGLRGCSRFGDHAHGSSGDVDARFVGLLGCGGPGPRPIAAAPAWWADLLGRGGGGGAGGGSGGGGATALGGGAVALGAGSTLATLGRLGVMPGGSCSSAAGPPTRTTIVRPPAAAAARRAIAAGGCDTRADGAPGPGSTRRYRPR